MRLRRIFFDLMQIDKTIESTCASCGKSAELHEHYYGIGLAHKYSSYRLVIAPLYYDDTKNVGYCSSECATKGFSLS
jgi:hypothetical protein